MLRIYTRVSVLSKSISCVYTKQQSRRSVKLSFRLTGLTYIYIYVQLKVKIESDEMRINISMIILEQSENREEFFPKLHFVKPFFFRLLLLYIFSQVLFGEFYCAEIPL